MLLTQEPRTAKVLGFPIHIVDDYRGWLIERLKRKQGSHVATLNAEMVMQARKTPELATALQSADCVVPDGAGIVMHFMLRGKNVQRSPGIELSESLVQAIAQFGNSHSAFFFGAAPGVAAAAVDTLKIKYPGLTIARPPTQLDSGCPGGSPPRSLDCESSPSLP
jgi:N-acetylglucosaminyldiphosphoundecaprenol N-acetyl-beta-D-mannosaminyltransferase